MPMVVSGAPPGGGMYDEYVSGRTTAVWWVAGGGAGDGRSSARGRSELCTQRAKGADAHMAAECDVTGGWRRTADRCECAVTS